MDLRDVFEYLDFFKVCVCSDAHGGRGWQIPPHPAPAQLQGQAVVRRLMWVLEDPALCTHNH